MSRSDSIARPSRRHPLIRRVITRWRSLSGGSDIRDDDRRTLIACSAGADSSALAIALSTINPGPVLAHVLHDLRPPAEAEPDRDAAQRLAAALGLEFESAQVAVADQPGNPEANARHARYDALAEIAARRGLAYVATGHHADDQLETLIMRLARGAGPRGLRGILDSRPLTHAVTVVRPMLAIERADAETICRDAGWAWAEDRTNADQSRLRAAIRHGVLPALREAAPSSAAAACRAAKIQQDAHDTVAGLAGELLKTGGAIQRGWSWPRAALTEAPDIVVAEALRQALTPLVSPQNRDRLPSDALHRAVFFARNAKPGDARDSDGVKVAVTANAVTIQWI